jgi:hypothetical protein
VAEAETRSEPDVVTKASQRSVSGTVARFTDLLSAKGVRLIPDDRKLIAVIVGVLVAVSLLVFFKRGS